MQRQTNSLANWSEEFYFTRRAVAILFLLNNIVLANVNEEEWFLYRVKESCKSDKCLIDNELNLVVDGVTDVGFVWVYRLKFLQSFDVGRGTLLLFFYGPIFSHIFLRKV